MEKCQKHNEQILKLNRLKPTNEIAEPLPCTLVAIIPSSDWKRSHITPVHKDWVEDDPTNYRLNSSFSIIGKFLE